jgi:hypothetical protein
MGLLDYFTPKSPAEKLRENKRLIDRAVRELDRERVKLENQEKLIVVEMKKMAKIGQKVRRPASNQRCRRRVGPWLKTLLGRDHTCRDSTR